MGRSDGVTPPAPGSPVLFSSARSPHCFKISVTLLELGVAFDRVEIDLPAREQRMADYLAINPRGQVPAYLDADGAHLDSLDILLHLDARRRPPQLFPADPIAREATLAWIARSSGAMRDVSHHLYWQLLEPPAEGPDATRVAQLRAQGSELLEGVEAALAASRSGWLVDADDLAGPSAADICVYAWTSGYRRFELPSSESRLPHLGRWWRWWDERPSVRASRGAVGVPFRSWFEARGIVGGTVGGGEGPTDIG
jgi:glutathione S-transferase